MALEDNWVLVEDIDMEEGHKELSTVDHQIYDGDQSIHEESAWIHNQLEPVFGPISRDDIFRFLQMHHSQKLYTSTIPFIAMYRKEECLGLLKDPEQPEEENLVWHKVLWRVQELHRKWLLFQNQKRALQIHYNKLFEEVSRRGFTHDETPRLFESIMKSLVAAETEREVEDVNTKFNLRFPAGEGQAAIDISSDPDVRKYVRCNYFDFAEVSVSSIKPGLNMDCQRKPLNDLRMHNGATNVSCSLLREQLLGIASYQRPVTIKRLRVVYGDETLACLYENSQISVDQLPGQSGIVRRAVCHGPSPSATKLGPCRAPMPGSQPYQPGQRLVSPCLGLVRGSAPDPDQFV
ncbi:hypothetical protein ACLB2K_000266 [Fragaria x ananassa]